MLNRVNDTYAILPTKEKGGITTVKLKLHTISFMSNGVITVLKFSLDDFGRFFWDELSGENKIVVVHWLL